MQSSSGQRQTKLSPLAGVQAGRPSERIPAPADRTARYARGPVNGRTHERRGPRQDRAAPKAQRSTAENARVPPQAATTGPSGRARPAPPTAPAPASKQQLESKPKPVSWAALVSPGQNGTEPPAHAAEKKDPERDAVVPTPPVEECEVNAAQQGGEAKGLENVELAKAGPTSNGTAAEDKPQPEQASQAPEEPQAFPTGNNGFAEHGAHVMPAGNPAGAAYPGTYSKPSWYPVEFLQVPPIACRTSHPRLHPMPHPSVQVSRA